MIIPVMIKVIDKMVFFDISSFSTRNESKGTKTYPSDSKIGKSLRFTPLLIAVIFIIKEPKKIAYAVITRQFNIERMSDLCFLFALFFRSSCEHEERKIPITTNI